MIEDPKATLTMHALKEAADQLAYLNAPVEAHLTADCFIALRMMLPAPERPTSPLHAIIGLKLIVDPDLPKWRIEFRDQKGKVVSSFDLFDL